MGGIGSGGHNRKHSRTTLEHYPALRTKDIRHLLDVTSRHLCIEVEGSLILIEGMPKFLGGLQHFFLCPCCMTRRGTLRRLDIGLYRCRECIGGRYASQRESHSNKALRAQEKLITTKLNGCEVVKPKRMREKTFSRYLNQLEEIEKRIWACAPSSIRILAD